MIDIVGTKEALASQLDCLHIPKGDKLRMTIGYEKEYTKKNIPLYRERDAKWVY